MVFSEQDEGDNHGADDRADDQREDEEDCALVVLQAETLPARDFHQRVTGGVCSPQRHRDTEKKLKKGRYEKGKRFAILRIDTEVTESTEKNPKKGRQEKGKRFVILRIDTEVTESTEIRLLDFTGCRSVCRGWAQCGRGGGSSASRLRRVRRRRTLLAVTATEARRSRRQPTQLWVFLCVSVPFR
jgi:uncharacterized protein (DUF4415 family)